MAVEVGMTMTPKALKPGDFTMNLVLEEYAGSMRVRSLVLYEEVSGQDAKRILTDLRDLADRALARHFPEDRPRGRHMKEAISNV